MNFYFRKLVGLKIQLQVSTDKAMLAYKSKSPQEQQKTDSITE